MSISSHYGEHVVAFVDILGFAQLVQLMDHDKNLIDEIFGVLSRINEEDVSWSFGDWINEGPANLTVASDSIFFSISFQQFAASGANRDPGWACLAEVESVFALQRYLLKRGIMTRGGLALGSLLHHQNVIFGPALVHAYRIESQVAFYPRVIIAPEVLERIRAFDAPAHFAFELRLEALTTRDADGLTFVDYLNYNAGGIENVESLEQLFNAIRQSIEAALLANRGDTRVYQKVAWLANYFNRSRSRWLRDTDLAEFRTAFDRIAPIDVMLMLEPT
jgi:hypothetical protein